MTLSEEAQIREARDRCIKPRLKRIPEYISGNDVLGIHIIYCGKPECQYIPCIAHRKRSFIWKYMFAFGNDTVGFKKYPPGRQKMGTALNKISEELKTEYKKVLVLHCFNEIRAYFSEPIDRATISKIDYQDHLKETAEKFSVCPPELEGTREENKRRVRRTETLDIDDSHPYIATIDGYAAKDEGFTEDNLQRKRVKYLDILEAKFWIYYEDERDEEHPIKRKEIQGKEELLEYSYEIAKHYHINVEKRLAAIGVF